jgi:hypothetical protein
MQTWSSQASAQTLGQDDLIPETPPLCYGTPRLAADRPDRPVEPTANQPTVSDSPKSLSNITAFHSLRILLLIRLSAGL